MWRLAIFVTLAVAFGVLAMRCHRETAMDVKSWQHSRELAARSEDVDVGRPALEFVSEIPADDDPLSRRVSEKEKRRRREEAERREARARRRAAFDAVRSAILAGDPDAVVRAVEACLETDHDPEDRLDPISCAKLAYQRALLSKENLPALADLYAEQLEARGEPHQAAEVHVDVAMRLERGDREAALARYRKARGLFERFVPGADATSSLKHVDAHIATLKKRRSR